MNDSRIIYEFPITNRVRSFLRFEYLIEKMESSIHRRGSPLEAMHTLHQLFDLIRHNDIKSELLRHIRWQEQELQKFIDSTPVDQNKLAEIVNEKQQTIKALDSFKLPMSDYINNHFLNSIKLRLSIPGGTCNFDLPQLHAWQHFDEDIKYRELQDWFKPFTQIKAALKSTLSLTRMSAEFSKETAEGGCYISDFPQHRHSYCLIRVASTGSPAIYPEVSAGLRHFTIYFFKIERPEKRPCQARQNVEFELARCIL